MCDAAPHLQTPHSTSVPFIAELISPRRKACASNSDHRRDSRCGSPRSRRRIRRPDVDRFPRRSRTPLRRGEGERHGGCHQDEQGDDPADARDVGQHRADQAGECGELRTIPAYNFNDLDDFVRNAQSQDAEVSDDGLGNAEVGERQQDAQLPSHLDEQLPELHEGARLTLLRPHRRPAVRAVLRDLERVEPRPVPLAAVQLERQDREPRGLREARGGGLRRASRRAAPRRSSRSARRPRTAATIRKVGSSDSVRPGTFAEGVAKANKKLKFDAWAHHPYPVPVNGKPTQKVLWPNVALTSLPRSRRRSTSGSAGRTSRSGSPSTGTRPSRVSRRA